MNTFLNDSSQLNSALFVDFDNIYSNLAEQDTQAAEQFATRPERWLAWLEKQLPMNYVGSFFNSRRLLIRRCYLNPAWYSEYRPHFIRAAFEVIDCPPLTKQGKTSTDIHLVMDTLDALSHKTYFHEFIILSADADFTPLLLNLRKYARYSAILSIGYSSPAYRASCDNLIKQSKFIESALGITELEEENTEVEFNQVNGTMEPLLKKMADRIFEAAVLPSGIPANNLPEIYKEFPEFRQSNHWLGFNSLKRLTREIVSRNADLVIFEDEDSWSVARKMFDDWLLSATESNRIAGADSSHLDLRDQIAAWIINLVKASPAPIVLSAVAQSVLQKFGDQGVDSNWLGAGSFKSLLQQLDLGSLQFLSRKPGYLYDPDKHSVSEQGLVRDIVVKLPVEDSHFSQYPDLAPLALKIHRLTDMPYLNPVQYALLFTEIAREVNEHGYQMTRTSRTVRDRCIERGAPIARSHVNFILTGLSYVGHRIGDGQPETAEEIGRDMVRNTINLCHTAQFELSEDEKKLVEIWLLSKINREND